MSETKAPMLAESIRTLTTALAGRYRVERVVGSGGMATVYVADDLRHNRKVAIKVLRPDIAAILGKERFFREIELTAGLQHPHILPLFDSGGASVGDGDLLYYVMPYVDGESLRDRLRREQQLPIEDALRIAREVASALTYAASRGIVHRDIKPENILLTQESATAGSDREVHAVLTDFGIARAVAETGVEHLTKAGTTLGTPPYMSPEQASGDRPIDARADVYALACVMFEMLAGEPPFTGPTAQAILVKHLTEPVPELRRRRDSVPEHVNAAITRALAKLPADRFTSARHFVDALDGRGSEVTHAPRGVAARWLRRPLVTAGLVAAAALITMLASDVGSVRTRLTGRAMAVVPVTDENRRSIAVLPFDNVGGNPAEEYFSDGLTEELIASLSQVRSLRVAARTSAFAFKNQARDVRQIARALNVSSLLVGSVRKAQDRIRVTAQLIDARTGLDLWSQTYDERALAQVFDVQADIAQRIAAALEASLTPAEQRRLAAKPTENLDAYILYLKGRHYWNKRGAQLDTAIQFFNRAIAIDPQYARAYAGLAAVYGPQGVHGYIHPDKGRAAMGEASRRAVALDDGLAEAHAVLGAYLNVYEWNPDAAEREFRRAIELDRNFPTAHEWYGYMLENMGRFDEAIKERWLARSLEPLVPGPGPLSPLVLSGQYDSAKTVARDAIALDPTYWQTHYRFGDALAATGDLSGSVAEYERATVMSSGAAEPPAALARVLVRLGKTARAREVVAEIQQKSARTGIKHPDVASALFALGDTTAAFDWLEAGFRQRHPAMMTLLVGSAFAEMRPDPRFQNLLRRVGFPSTRR